MSLLHRRSPGVGGVRPVTYEVLTFNLVGSVTAANNGTTSVDLVKASGTDNWGSDSAYTSTGWTAPVTLEFNKLADASDNGVSYAMISLNEDPTTDANYSSLDYAAYPYRTDVYSVYHNSSQVNFSGSYNTANKFYIVYRTDGQLLHYNGSTLLYSVAWGTGRTLYIDSAFYSVNSTYSKYSNVRLIRKVWNGTAYV
jgi:hypothetical protein